ncbi:diphosphomevalonate decarboxylase-like isoform X1 [Acyrthosiphon pisum]|uniref:Diphosphomevalonate decarboxylase n=2 Tax=Acyrthosiphon pisum TaxID=7029 RepID=A0A8R2NTM7_ACYPI|nr:diphosphomevalonate decarboxylase-like isoform X1 [Acyrthosiphon pisum]|eukprot:XP_001950422.2 PREDICTED: diphosphomevalonate decarboxylase-like isoform X1 [Acyrthosiphon pisum]
MDKVVTCVAPVNIAVIKYWGKRDEHLILPLNDSVSLTLDCDQMHTKTSIIAGPFITEDCVWLNGQIMSIERNERLKKCFDLIRNLIKIQKGENSQEVKWKIRVCSENNFPTAAGLASSAAGYACLVYTLANAFGLVNGDLPSIARQGSGSACRSIYGGFVQWTAGVDDQGYDSTAVQIAADTHWPEMRIIILVVNDSKKKTSSTVGMKQAVKTSELLKYRIQKCVPERTKEIIQAITDKNFEKFAEITMRDSNQFHAICLDTYPPCVYLNQVSHEIISFVHDYNEATGQIKVSYTFYAGPNAFLFIQQIDLSLFMSELVNVFPTMQPNSSYLRGIVSTLPNNVKPYGFKSKDKDLLKYIMVTKLGNGPKCVDDHLLNSDGTLKSKIESTN